MKIIYSNDYVVLTKSLLSYLRRHQEVFRDHETVSMDEVLQTRTLQDYDEKITTKLWGYQTVHEYYDEASCKHVLDNIQIPLLVLQALDDPIIPRDVIPWNKVMSNPNIILAATDIGGHIAWLQGWNPANENFADLVSVEYVHNILSSE